MPHHLESLHARNRHKCSKAAVALSGADGSCSKPAAKQRQPSSKRIWSSDSSCAHFSLSPSSDRNAGKVSSR